MKSHFQKKGRRKSKRQSIMRKIQKGGMSTEDSIKLLMGYGCSGMEASLITVGMTRKDGVVDDAIFHATVFLHNQHKKSWSDALLISVPSNGDMNIIKLFLDAEAAQKKNDGNSLFKTNFEPAPKSFMAWFQQIQAPKLKARPHPGGVPPKN